MSRPFVLVGVLGIVGLGLLGGCPAPGPAGTDGPDLSAPAADLRPPPDLTAPDAADPGAPLPALPLHTQGRWILDARGQRFKLAAVSWYGAEEKDHVVAGLDRLDLRAIAAGIRQMGFNAVRLPWSNELYEQDPPIAADRVTKNPGLAGLHALQVLDEVIAALAHEGLVVVLDNHVSRADWCCSDTDGNGLWHATGYPESSWLADWRGIVTRYLGQPAVIGAELRNELRPADGQAPVWGGGAPLLDWHAAAERGGEAVLGANPDLLIIVDGLSYSADLKGAYTLPVHLSKDGRLVYAPHDYSFFHSGSNAYPALKKLLGDNWGFLLAQGQAYTAPLWVSEFGTCHTQPTCVSDTTGAGQWFQSFRMYLSDADIDWSYWALNGTQATGTGRTYGAEETYGVLDTTWTHPALDALLGALQAQQPITQHP